MLGYLGGGAALHWPRREEPEALALLAQLLCSPFLALAPDREVEASDDARSKRRHKWRGSGVRRAGACLPSRTPGSAPPAKPRDQPHAVVPPPPTEFRVPTPPPAAVANGVTSRGRRSLPF
ncbi:unnamed protein product [Urochloa humidicola]